MRTGVVSLLSDPPGDDTSVLRGGLEENDYWVRLKSIGSGRPEDIYVSSDGTQTKSLLYVGG